MFFFMLRQSLLIALCVACFSIPRVHAASGSAVTPPLPKTSAVKGVVVPILLYHYVEHVNDPKDVLRMRMNIRPAILLSQLNALQKNGYQTVFVRDIPGMIAHPTPQRSVALSFDDGYEDFYTDAFPLLKAHQDKSTLYVVNNFLDKPGYLTTAQLKEIAASGLVEIGSHSLDHPNLRQLKSEEIKRQIAQSKKGLEALLGINVQTFAYPYGSFNALALRAVKDAGFSAAVTTMGGIVHDQKSLLTLTRLRAGAFEGKGMMAAIGMRASATKDR